ncbi:hypothetical protein [Cecembia rubra]|uniref:Dolichyl-phosphate-mannose-protein mannosyltransferase n=1 Tax=Cecembia rubra TaxID=1485585 RepID=A0A2P8E4Z8_9BACT|nr:hypothetical protein [Cecembia rubra]PSL04497.1 hypothetical protein CLV48_105242 [Cecembia rubra]
MLVLSSIYWFILTPPILQPEMIWQLIGERMSEGNMMYRDILDDSGPFSAIVYWILFVLFGKSILVQKIIASFFLLLQIAYLNYLFNQYKSFDETSYVPAFIGVILVHLSFDLLSLSPALMGSTFIVFALGQLFSQTVLQKEGSDSVLLTGIFSGIAVCFHFPLVFFLPYMVVIGIIISGFSFRQLLISLSGYLLPILICSVYYFWKDALSDFIYKYILTFRTADIYVHVRLRDISILYAVPILFSFLGLFLGAIIRPLTVNQQKQLQLMMFFFVFAASSFLLTNRSAPYQLIILLTPFTYFISMLFLSLKRGHLYNGLSIAFVVLVPFVGWGWLTVQTLNDELRTYGVFPNEQHQITENKKILVLSDDLAYFKNAKQATPYLNYHLTRDLLGSIDNLHEISQAYKNISLDLPEVVVDEDGVFEAFLEKVPILKQKFQKSGKYYLLKSK